MAPNQTRYIEGTVIRGETFNSMLSFSLLLTIIELALQKNISRWLSTVVIQRQRTHSKIKVNCVWNENQGSLMSHKILFLHTVCTWLNPKKESPAWKSNLLGKGQRKSGHTNVIYQENPRGRFLSLSPPIEICRTMEEGDGGERTGRGCPEQKESGMGNVRSRHVCGLGNSKSRQANKKTHSKVFLKKETNCSWLFIISTFCIFMFLISSEVFKILLAHLESMHFRLASSNHHQTLEDNRHTGNLLEMQVAGEGLTRSHFWREKLSLFVVTLFLHSLAV